MFLDARACPADAAFECDLCIVGAGPAGITLALELARAGRSVTLLEAGGLRFSGKSQTFYEGEADPGGYDLRRTRTRQFGGSSNCWAGWNRPFSPIDLEAREWVPYSGWPIGTADLAPYAMRAAALLQLTNASYEAADWEAFGRSANAPLMSFGDSGLENIISHLSPPTRFGRVYRAEIGRSERIRVLLHAPVVNLSASAAGTAVDHVEVALPGGARFIVRARTFVLAAGGVENSRLLLNSRDANPRGLGNQNDMVGRYFMDHPRLRLGKLVLHGSPPHSRYYDVSYYLGNCRFADGAARTAASIGLTIERQRREALLQAHLGLIGSYVFEDRPAVTAAKALAVALVRRNAKPVSPGTVAKALAELPLSAITFSARRLRHRRFIRHFTLQGVIEPEPDPNNRVTLSRQRDALGLNRVRLRWRIGDSEKRSYLRCLELFKAAVEGQGLGRIELPAAQEIDWEGSVETTWHHMGTTRMSRDPRHGVVDADCRVHGIGNLYIAGSSVFATGGGNMPTFNIVALALRLADRLKALSG